MKENDFVKKALDSIVTEWVNTGKLSDFSSIIGVDSKKLKMVIAERHIALVNETQIWQDYYKFNNVSIRKVLRGELADLDEMKSSAKYKRIYNNGETEGFDLGEITLELNQFKESLSTIVGETNDYYIRLTKLRPAFDTPENDSLYNNLSKVTESYFEHISFLGQIIDSVVESGDLNMVAILSDKLRVDFMYDLSVMSRYLNKTLTNIKQ